MGKGVFRTDRLSRLQEGAKKRWSGYVEDNEVRFIVKKNAKSSVVKVIERKVKPEPEPVVEKVVPVYRRPEYMETDAEKHFVLAMRHVGIYFYQYVPAKPPKPKKIKVPRVRKRLADIDPITHKKVYQKKNAGPEKTPIVRAPAVYNNQTVESIYEKYGV